MEKTLFLHWGPGGNSQAELKAFKSHFSPNFIFWAQPFVTPNQKHPYLNLVDLALAELTRIYETKRKPVHLFAHSFGAQLALEAAKRDPEKISRLTLVSPLYSLKTAYTYLGNRFAKHYQDNELKDITGDFEKNPCFSTFIALFQKVTGHVDFMDLFWGSSPKSTLAKKRFMEVAADVPILHTETFVAVMKDLFDFFSGEAYFRGLTPPEKIPVEIHLGKEDPYFNIELNREEWKKRIPHAKVSAHPTGHFIHLETDLVWT